MTEFLNKHLLVVGTARNCGQCLRSDIAKLVSALKSFENLYWLIVESDSDDNTRQVLNALSAEVRNFRSISLGKLRNEIPFRTQRLAHCRNIYIEELRNNTLYSDIDFVVVADLDGVNNAISEKAILSCWARTDWDVCAANQAGPYYDIWALRHQFWSPNDCWLHKEFLESRGVDPEIAMYSAVDSRRLTIPESTEWIEVGSAFGGLAIYRRKAIEGSRYVGLDEKGREVCEHVPLHFDLLSKGCRIFINPLFVNAKYASSPTVRRLKRIVANILGFRRILKLLSV